MDNTIKPTGTINASQQPSAIKNRHTLFIVGILILMLFIAAGAYYLGLHNGESSLDQKQPNAIVSKNKPTQVPINTSDNLQGKYSAVYNLNGGASNLKYFRSQISAPSDYFATDDNLVTSYTSQGGMAPPRIILMKEYQVNKASEDGYIDYFSAIHETKNDCIVIWSTGGFSSIEDWNNTVTDLKGKLIEQQVITVGKRKAQLYKLVKIDGNIYVALLPIGDKDSTSYYFHTCNANNKSDFMHVIQSIKFRDDVSF